MLIETLPAHSKTVIDKELEQFISVTSNPPKVEIAINTSHALFHLGFIDFTPENNPIARGTGLLRKDYYQLYSRTDPNFSPIYISSEITTSTPQNTIDTFIIQTPDVRTLSIVFENSPYNLSDLFEISNVEDGINHAVQQIIKTKDLKKLLLFFHDTASFMKNYGINTPGEGTQHEDE